MYDNDPIVPLAVTVQSTQAQKVVTAVKVVAAAAGLGWYAYQVYKNRQRQQLIEDAELRAAQNYERQTAIQVETAEAERKIALKGLGSTLEEIQAMLNGDAAAIARNLPETADAQA